MNDLFQKALLYLQPTGNYWQLAAGNPGEDAPEWLYPLDITPRLRTNHFNDFDPDGLPVDARSGSLVAHNYTTLCAFGLAHWSLYLLGGQREEHLRHLLASADYILRTAERDAGAMVLRSEHLGRGHVGALSGMYQGEAISVLCRAYVARGDARYLDAAEACALPFERDVGSGGVRSTMSGLGLVWYDEHTIPPVRHVLNGMIYALWGLSDLAKLSGSPRAKRLYDDGLESLVASLPGFDYGWWSAYDIPEIGPSYIASMMYHELHICQLTALARTSKSGPLADAAARFRRYAGSPVNRVRAAVTLARAKTQKMYHPEAAPPLDGGIS